MAKIIGIYNNKGGVGKTTLTLFLSDFLSSIRVNQKNARVLVLDFDPQNSASHALLGLEQVTDLKHQQRTLAHACLNRLPNKTGQEAVKLSDFIATRPAKNNPRIKKTQLGKLDVMISDELAALQLEESITLADSIAFAKWLKEELNKDYDFIFIDLPAGLSKRNGYSLIGAFLADYFIIPIEPNRLNINTLPMTALLLDNIRDWQDQKQPFKLLGFVLNKTDRRTKQYQRHKDELIHFAERNHSKIYKNILPPTPKLANASDDSIEFFSLAGRYDTYYDHVRKIVYEIAADLGFKTKKRAPTKDAR